MSNKEKEVDELEKKKRQLENELTQIQEELDESIDRVRHDVSSHLDPKALIEKYPLTTVGASVLLGFLAGHKGRRNHTGPDSSAGTGALGSALLAEIKKLATRKAVSLATEYLEKVLKKKEDPPTAPSVSNNDSPEH